MKRLQALWFWRYEIAAVILLGWFLGWFLLELVRSGSLGLQIVASAIVFVAVLTVAFTVTLIVGTWA